MDERQGLFEELKQRQVFRAAGLYLVVAWLLLEVGETTFDALGAGSGTHHGSAHRREWQQTGVDSTLGECPGSELRALVAVDDGRTFCGSTLLDSHSQNIRH